MPTLTLPYAHLNLRQNPFGHVDLAERSEIAVVDVDAIAARLDSPGYAVQFVGDCGYGKTTHLLALAARFPGMAYVHVAEGERPPIPVGSPLFVDECQRVPRRVRRQVFRRGVPLVLGTHEDFNRELRAAGYDVETVEVAHQTTPERVCELLNRRVEHARRGAGPVPRVSEQMAHALRAKLGPNVRAIEAHLYEVFLQLDEIRDV